MRNVLFGLLTLVLLCGGCPPPAQRLTPADLSVKRPGADVLVVVYSRTGSTARVGLTLAAGLKADYLRLLAPKGIGDSYLATPNRHKNVKLKPSQVDLSRYRLVLLGSPIWYWYPSVVIYSFIKAHDWSGKRVVLFYTFRGGIRDAAGPEWTSQVARRGGRVVDFFGFNCKKLAGTSLEALARARLTSRRQRWLPVQPRLAPRRAPPGKKRGVPSRP